MYKGPHSLPPYVGQILMSLGLCYSITWWKQDLKSAKVSKIALM